MKTFFILALVGVFLAGAGVFLNAVSHATAGICRWLAAWRAAK